MMMIVELSMRMRMLSMMMMVGGRHLHLQPRRHGA
jgi:hypothetical protein